MKILVIVIASFNEPHYELLLRKWRMYMNRDENVKSYFVIQHQELFENILDTYMLSNDTLYLKGYENGIPSIYEKSCFAISLLMTIHKDIDYVVRTNLSSFWIWSRLISFLQDKPRHHYVLGHVNKYKKHVYYPSGCGFVMSTDVALKLSQQFDHPIKYQVPDDVAFGIILNSLNIALHHNPYLAFSKPLHTNILTNIEQYLIPTIPENVFHLRVRHGDDVYRRTIEPIIYYHLVSHFYYK